MFPAGVAPLQERMFQNVSCSVNNCQFMARPSEILGQINRMTIPNKVASKIGLPYPTYDGKRCYNAKSKRYDNGADNPGFTEVPTDYEWKGYEKWRK